VNQILAVQKVAIYGARGFARELHQLLIDLTAAGMPHICVGFIVDPGYVETEFVHDLPVYDHRNILTRDKAINVVIGIGETRHRYRIAKEIEREFGERFSILKHPVAWVGHNVPAKTGSIICAGALVTTDISIGAHTHLHVGSKIGHDTIIDDFVTVAPGATVSGRVHIGEGVFVGAGAVILPDIKIGAWSIIGAGAVVTKDVPNDATVVGVPARITSRRKPGWHLTS
jgi:sugar O-acyltransferase (sialic acid O-acetyltransferase NeuD family)